MLDMYGQILVAVGIMFLLVTFCKPKEAKLVTSKPFSKFQSIFLTVYLIMMAGDWLQGPTVYALYNYYGFSRKENGILFIAGFGSSMIFGTFAGTLADKYGRKVNCIVYGIVYALCCVTKHFNNYYILMVGRLLGGFATSILASAFESWMVSEHHTRGFEESWIANTFSLMTIGNGLVAISCGFLAQGAVYLYGGHPVAPFDLSMALLILGMLVIFVTWTENYGDAAAPMSTGLKDAFRAVMSDRKVFLLGAIQSMFEGAMYTFVFMWTPTLEQSGNIPHGLIFASFMICCSIGGSCFSFLVTRYKVERFMRFVFLVAALAMCVPMFTKKPAYVMGAFCVYEVAVGIFWPGMGTMRSKYVPEEGRATIMNIFRIPLNALVCLILVYQGDLPINVVFIFCVAFIGICAGLQCGLVNAVESGRISGDEEEGFSPGK